MKVAEITRFEALPFSEEAFRALSIPEIYHFVAMKAMKLANAEPRDVRRYRHVERDCDAVFVTGVGADGEIYDWSELIKERA